MKVPVVFIIFNRPKTTRKVFEAIREYKPKQLFVIADGPRPDKLGEEESCKSARLVIEEVDWECEIFKRYSNTNLGCKKGISSGLNWVFEHVDEAIILEDDCLPDMSFFRYCSELLEKYRYDTRVMSITGQNVQKNPQNLQYSYYFSRHFHCWGWATWKRAWHHFDLEIRQWPEVRELESFKHIFPGTKAFKYWRRILDKQYKNKFNSWSFSASFSFLIQNGLHIHPSKNLIHNIGFGPNATNTKSLRLKRNHENMYYEMGFPLLHPPYVLQDTKADKIIQDHFFESQKIYDRAIIKLRKALNI
ncbi:glycosyltransferase family 2 protein [Nodosilinea sp. P-1105]|uniref:glycosyltransferase family 2 protein n=1 Tax=Nodosilinea sp. P-1105 TaxID=2546229 RepID=UPI00146B70D0|nr:glycosyltransferase family 2 protein [Nodosilinea sp. P-1105]NMF83035.1 glycosyltransferase family 2 protein [Nodosilinea sp. P-1105]